MIMGGDNAPKAQVLGAMKAVEAFSDVEITLVGNKAEISPYLTEHDRINVIHTEEKILSTDEPVRAVRRKKSASMVLAAQQVADGEADACISSGMYKIGQTMPSALRETAQGGLAATPTGRELEAKIFGLPLNKK